MKKLFLILLPVAMLLPGCQPSPEPIDYGSDMCDFCKMTIVDQQHGAEVVTQKGKVFKFDAIECMVNYVEQSGENTFEFLLVNDFTSPGELVDARACHYLISEKLPSPMGANLTAFAGETAAREMLSERGGALYEWDDLKAALIKQGIVRK